MTLACEDANSKLVEVVIVADVDDEDRDTVIFGAIIRQQDLVCAKICFPKLGRSSNAELAISPGS